MSTDQSVAADLRQHLAACEEALALSEQESRTLHSGAPVTSADTQCSRKRILPWLTESLKTLRKHRLAWQSRIPADRHWSPEIVQLIRQSQDMIMRVLVLDRENEQVLLRKGLVPPAHVPSTNSQRPHFVAELYRRNRA